MPAGFFLYHYSLLRVLTRASPGSRLESVGARVLCAAASALVSLGARSLFALGARGRAYISVCLDTESQRVRCRDWILSGVLGGMY